ncbi:MAG: LysM domain-containing protein [Planctomycetota bacterium]|nr:LysM domain-containing protein [Planctomycetota bacterium]
MRIGIAIGLVIILGVVVYFIFSNRPEKPVEHTTASQPAAPRPFQITVAQGPLRPIPGAPTESPRPVSVDSLVAGAAGDKSKTDLAPVGGKSDLKGPDLLANVTPDPKREVKPVDPVEMKMRQEFERDGEVSMRGGGSDPVNSRDPGITGKGFDLAMSNDPGTGVVKTEMGRREPPRGDLAKVETAKVGPGPGPGKSGVMDSIVNGGPGKTGGDEGISNILRTEADKTGGNVSDDVRKGEHVVVAGDNGAYGIAKKVYGDMRLGRLIVEANPNVNWHRLKVGDKVKIPPPPAKPAPTVKPGDLTGGPGGGVSLADDKSKYTVKSGDNGFSGIAKSFYGDAKHWKLIQGANPGVDSARLRPGTVLTMPPKPASPTSGPGAGGGSAGGAGGLDLLISGSAGRTGGTSGDDQGKYTVKSGDNGFAGIAKSFYGETKYWKLIQGANPGVDSTRLRPGTVLTMPPKPAGSTGVTTRAASRAASNSGAGAPVVGKAAARRAAAAKLAAQKPAVAKKTVAKKTPVERPADGETGSSEMETAPAGGSSGGGNGFD